MPVGRKILKSVAKHELSRATGGVSDNLLSRVGVRPSTITAGSNLYHGVSAGKNMKGPERNKKPRPPKGAEEEEGKKLTTASLQRTYDDMIVLEKQAELFEKRAATGRFMSSMKKNPLLTTMGTAAALTLGQAAIRGGVSGAGSLYKKLKGKRVWKTLARENPALTKHPDAKEHFAVLQQFSPDLATNKTTARSYLERMQQTRMVPHEFVGDLVRTQKGRYDMSLQKGLDDIASSSVGTSVNYQTMVGKQKELNLNRNKFRAQQQQFDRTYEQRQDHHQDDVRFKNLQIQQGDQRLQQSAGQHSEKMNLDKAKFKAQKGQYLNQTNAQAEANRIKAQELGMKSQKHPYELDILKQRLADLPEGGGWA